jgi:hypothetical protein
MAISKEDLENRFSFHPAEDEVTRQAHQTVRDTCLRMAVDFVKIVPDGREQDEALDKIEEVMFWANAGIARNK